MSTSNDTYKAVWDGLLEVSRARYYYAGIERLLQVPVFIVRFLLALSGCGVFVSIFSEWPWIEPAFGPAFGLAVAVLVVLDLFLNGTKRLAQVKAVNASLEVIEGEYRALWESVRNGDIEGHDAVREKRRLLNTMTHVTGVADVWNFKRVNQTAVEQAYEVEGQRYAT